MLLLIDVCQNSGTLKAIYIVKIFFQIVLCLLPLIVIVTSMAKVFKSVTSGKEEDLKEALKPCVQKIISAFIVMLLPTMINYVMKKLGYTV